MANVDDLRALSADITALILSSRWFQRHVREAKAAGLERAADLLPDLAMWSDTEKETIELAQARLRGLANETRNPDA